MKKFWQVLWRHPKQAGPRSSSGFTFIFVSNRDMTQQQRNSFESIEPNINVGSEIYACDTEAETYS